MGLYSPFCVGFIIEDYKKADFLEFPAAVFQQMEELFCMVAVVYGVVEFGGDWDFTLPSTSWYFPIMMKGT